MIFGQSTIHIHSGFVIAGTNVQQARAGLPVFGQGKCARVPDNVTARQMAGTRGAGIHGKGYDDGLGVVVALIPTIYTARVIGVGIEVPSTVEVQPIWPLK